ASATTAPAGTPSASGASTDPDGAGTLRQGDTGPEVVELEQRLLRIPDVYHGGSTAGTYDAALTAAVERFQVWYGISGDERGVYGDDTRRSLESRTSLTDS
ncbi:peptidoglycan-binding protein, partial [Streptomyces hyaluromycini]